MPYKDPEAKRAYDREYRKAERARQNPESPEITVITRDYTDKESLRVYPMGDFHIGSPGCNEEKLDEWLEYLANRENATLLNTGDNLNCAIEGSKSDQYGEKLTVQEGMWLLEDKLRRLAYEDRIDCITGGNHEARVYRATGIDPMAVVARTLGVPHYEGAAVVRYLVGKQEYLFWVRHGTGNAPASLPAITKAGLVSLADVYVTGHTHRQTVVLDDFFIVEDGQVVRRPRRYVTSGSFTLYERYAAERGYSPSHLGAPRIFLDGTRHDVHVSI